MPTTFQRFTPFFWFNGQAEEAAAFYTAIFDNSKIVTTTRYSKEIAQATGHAEGSVMTIAFELDGQKFATINGGPHFKFNEAISIVVNCQSQAEVDRYWERLGQGGDPAAQQCGWLKDKFGVSWQIVPSQLIELLSDPDPNRARRAGQAMMQMKKIDIDALRRAAAAA